MRLLLPALLLCLAGCPDPSQNKDKMGPQPGMGPNGEMAPPPGGPGGGPGGAPGGPGAPGGAAGGPPMAGMRPAARFSVAAGSGVKISGKVSYEGAKTGAIRIDFLRTTGSQFPELVHSVTLDALGPFETEAPKDFGSLQVMAFIDTADDGPSAGEPAGLWGTPLDIKDQPITGVDIVLSDRPELKDLAPPGVEKGGMPTPPAPPGGAPPPAEPLNPAGEVPPGGQPPPAPAGK